MEYTILAIDDEPLELKNLQHALKAYKIQTYCNPVETLSQIDSGKKYLFIIDYKMPGLTGLDFLVEIKKRNISYKAILLTAYAEKNILSQAINRSLINRILEKPYSTEDLERVIHELTSEQDASLEAIKQEIALLKSENQIINHIIGLDSGLLDIYKQVRHVAGLDVPVMLTGETGTGKEVIADLIHQLSPRKQYPIIKINCTTIQENLFESELFGYEKGAFTGADKMKKGKIELANRGTLFLDEIGEMKPDLQAKLLRVIETKEFSRLGGINEFKVDFRLITATNINLEQAVNERKFRADLYYRISKFHVKLPPLRDRKEDIIQFINLLEERITREINIDKKAFSEDAINLLINHYWAGNIRELENIIYQAIIASLPEKEITEQTVRHFMQQNDAEEYHKIINGIKKQLLAGKAGFKAIKKDVIISLLDECDHNVKKVAEYLSLTDKAIYQILKN